MDFVIPNRGLAPYLLRAMVTIGQACEGGLAQPHRAIIDAAQRVLLETEVELSELAPIEASELAETIDDPALARQIVRWMILMSMAEGPPSEKQTRLLEEFAAALEVEEPAVKAVTLLARGRRLRYRLEIYRQGNFADYLRLQYEDHGGLLGVARAILGFRGLYEDPALAARFEALGELPEDTLGAAFFRMYRDNGFSFPGQKGGFALGGMFHDFGHLLGGYDTTPEGEMKAAAFQAGFRRSGSGFFTLLFAWSIHTAGVNVAPFEMPMLRGRIAKEGLADEIFDAMRRGAQMKVDLGDHWDFWAFVELPIEQARMRLGVPPKAVGATPPVAA